MSDTKPDTKYWEALRKGVHEDARLAIKWGTVALLSGCVSILTALYVLLFLVK